MCVCVCVCLVGRWWLRPLRYKPWGRPRWCRQLRNPSVYHPRSPHLQVCTIVTLLLLQQSYTATSSTEIGNNVPLIWYKDKPGDTSELKWTLFHFIPCTVEKPAAVPFIPPPVIPPPPVPVPIPPTPTTSTAAPTTPTENAEKEQSKSPAPASDGKATPELDNM